MLDNFCRQKYFKTLSLTRPSEKNWIGPRKFHDCYTANDVFITHGLYIAFTRWQHTCKVLFLQCSWFAWLDCFYVDMFHSIVLFRLVYGLVYASATLSQSCQVTDVKSLLEGCDRLMGLNVTSVGGTIVNDHNCDVLLPKQVFAEEPLFQYELADSVSAYCDVN